VAPRKPAAADLPLPEGTPSPAAGSLLGCSSWSVWVVDRSTAGAEATDE
jgi:hypothetical protein